MVLWLKAWQLYEALVHGLIMCCCRGEVACSRGKVLRRRIRVVLCVYCSSSLYVTSRLTVT
jgi:hypothetical protein